MIRVLHVIGSLNNGGSQAMIMNLYRNIDRSRLQFDFVIDRPDELFFAGEVEALGGKIYVLPALTLKNLLSYKKSWKGFFKEHPEYKIIHGHVRSTASIYLRIGKKYGLTTIAHSHSTSSGSGFSALIKNFLQYFIKLSADYLLACSKDSGEWLYGKKACKKSNFLVINNAIDISRFGYSEKNRERVRRELNIENKLVIGHVGRFFAAKNHGFLLDIFNAVRHIDPNAVLLLVGDGELRHIIEKKVKESGISDSVLFTGVRDDIPELLQAMDVFVFPSLYEGVPVTLIEAQASGLPCIVSDIVTKEVCLTPIIRSVPLPEPASFWAEAVIAAVKGKRIGMEQHLKKSGYDIGTSVKKLSTFYESIERKSINEQIHSAPGRCCVGKEP